MNQYTWIYQLSAGGAVIFFLYLLLRFVIGKLSTSLSSLETTLREMETAMVSRDQIILNHLETFVKTESKISDNQDRQTEILQKLCREWGLNGGKK